MKIKDLRLAAEMRQGEFAKYFGIPLRTLQDWEADKRTPPPYLVELMIYKLTNEDKIKPRP